MYKLIGPDGKQYLSEEPGTLGGHRGMKIYGRLDCKSALRAIARPTGGTYIKNRVFFKDEETAIARRLQAMSHLYAGALETMAGG